MAISNDQKIDYLFKKLGYGKTKTDINSRKFATNEAISSPLLIRGDRIWAQSDLIPGAPPTESTEQVSVETYVQTVEDISSTSDRTWKTNLTDWISPEFGASYQLSVYAAAPGQSNPKASGTRLFAGGSGNNDEWFFDYQSGVLNFIGDNLPSALNGTNVIYISGYRYTGIFGVTSAEGVQGLIDSAYINSRVNANIDSAATIALIDSDYVQARQTDFFRDSAFVTDIVNNVYIQARDRFRDSLEFMDSAEVIQLVDSAYINARVEPNIDSAKVLQLIPDGDLQGLRDYVFLTTDNQSVFADYDYYGNYFIYTLGSAAVFVNGVMVVAGVDYTMTDRNTITFHRPFVAGNVVHVLNFTSSFDIVATQDEIDRFVDSNLIGSKINFNAIADSIQFISNDVIDEFNIGQYRSVKYLLQLEHESSNKYHFTEILLLHNDSSVFMTEYGVITTDSELGTFDADILNNSVRLLCTPAYPNTEIKSKRISNNV